MEVKCACGGKDCPVYIILDSGAGLWFNDQYNVDHLMRMDANAAVSLITAVKAYLKELGGG